MQAISRRASASVASTMKASSRVSNTLTGPSRRTYADVQRGPGGEPQGETSKLPLIAAVGIVAFIPLYYFTQGTIGTGNKKPGEGGGAEIKAHRREHGTENEYRDPRDSGVKTLADKAKKENANTKQN